MSINLVSIMAKVNSYAKSNEGRTRTQEYLKGIASKGGHTTASGKNIYNEEKINELIKLYIDILRATARSFDLPDSVMKHIDNMTYSNPQYLKEGCYIGLYFDGDLSRPSLNPDDYGDPGDKDRGVDGKSKLSNIVALFNNGYDASKTVFGWWEGHSPTNESIYRSGVNAKDAWIRSLQSRPALNFIQEATNDFNKMYGKQYDITISIDPMYYM